MRKTLLCAVFMPLVLNAQNDYKGRVGINTTEPKATLEISRKELNTLPDGYAQGVLFPEFTTKERLSFSPNTKKGTLIYNKDKSCIEIYQGFINGVHEWTCTSTDAGTTVSNPVATATATLGAVQDIKFVVFKHNGKDYLVQGSNIMTTGITDGAEITVEVPYSNAQPTNGDYSAYEQTLALKNASGYMQDFKLYYPEGNFAGVAAGTIQAKLKNVSGATYYPALAPLDGIYHNAISNANAYTISLNGNSTTTLRVQTLTGIPDRCFDKTTSECMGSGATEKEHNFVYLPITVMGTYDINGRPYSKEWLNLNLGADYANANSPYFNPAQQATSPTDYKAYGSLFQWGRIPDGHELISWSSPTSGSPKRNVGWYNNTQLPSFNDPCPLGWRTPTQAQLQDLHQALTNNNQNYIYDSQTWNQSAIRLPNNGARTTTNNTFVDTGVKVNLWSRDRRGGASAQGFIIRTLDLSTMPTEEKTNGYGIRCIKE
ncbi:FISUMP domain-containing protein [Riemerella anatipestifer]|nr:FISUMP domain-containing protein [Riemerella anatipestifer]MDY3326114.1 FISUMP domain-containing protein [Riemerella anatipestifer]MDY3351092.1 FISUMP domain-containing protein [Riemerella anatipestifer]MDY3354464.1 FISUMP domain-containing protein [Riemerella anatipestifer]